MNDEKDKPIRVSDWSQKYKLIIYAISGGGLLYLGIRIVDLLTQIRNLLTTLSVKP